METERPCWTHAELCPCPTLSASSRLPNATASNHLATTPIQNSRRVQQSQGSPFPINAWVSNNGSQVRAQQKRPFLCNEDEKQQPHPHTHIQRFPTGLLNSTGESILPRQSQETADSRGALSDDVLVPIKRSMKLRDWTI